MSKIAQYLNEHILGEITGDKSIRERFSRDASVLSLTPELVAFPKVTNDIRKIARFAWQLAEKGHVLSLTARGGGSDQTGAAIGRGIIINTTAHLSNIIFVSLKGKEHSVHVQPGVRFKALNDTLKSHGLTIPTYPVSADFSTIGGAVANNSAGTFSGIFGSTGEWVNRLEVVLANGDLMETIRINKHELNKKKGLQTFEGEIYRKIDGLIEDNQQLITDKLTSETRDNTGYRGISQVKRRDGSFDLTPLFIGSQGTLGIISEIVMRTDFYNTDESIIVATFKNSESARDASDSLKSLQPVQLEMFDGELFSMARAAGKKYPLFGNDTNSDAVGSVLYICFNDFNNSARNRKMKRALKKLEKFNGTISTSEDHSPEELYAVRDVESALYIDQPRDESYTPLVDGASIPSDRHEEFSAAVAELAAKHHVKLPLHTRCLDGVISTRPALYLGKVGDKQKVFRIINEYIDLVVKCGGSPLADSAEGRLKVAAVYSHLDDEVVALFGQIREAFDPFGILNPGVKQKEELRDLVSALRSEYSLADFAGNATI